MQEQVQYEQAHQETAAPASQPNAQTYQAAAPAGPINPPMYQASMAPVGQLKTNKSLLKYILLSIITCGIYGLVVMSSVSNDINVVASRYDGKRTMHYCLLFFLVGPITFGIGYLVWYHKISARIGAELQRRQIPYSFGAADYWLWNILGTCILVGPFIYLYKLFKATNKMCEHYNING